MVDDDGAQVRDFIDNEVHGAPAGLAGRWRELLHSLDNRRFVQGLGEVATYSILKASGWTALGVEDPGPMLVFQSPDGTAVDVGVLTFASQLRPLADRKIIESLVRGLDRLTSRSRIAVVVRRWLPHDFDPEPVRRAIDMWLQEVERGGWEGRYAAYDDEAVSLEFALTGRRAQTGEGLVAFTLGPLDALRTLECVQGTISQEFARWRHAARPSERRPLFAVCTSTQPWRLPPGYLREAMLGKPVAITTAENEFLVHYGEEQSPSLLRDPLHRDIEGVLFIEHAASDPARISGQAFLNPWCQTPRDPEHLQVPCLAAVRRSPEHLVMGWFHRN
jgi:hypothetical protein